MLFWISSCQSEPQPHSSSSKCVERSHVHLDARPLLNLFKDTSLIIVVQLSVIIIAQTIVQLL